MGVGGGEAADGKLTGFGVDELRAADGTKGGGGVGRPLVASLQVWEWGA